MSGYLEELLAQGRIERDEYEVLAATGALSPEELYAVTAHFADTFADALPSGNLAKISAIAGQTISPAFRNSVVSNLGAPVEFAHGVNPPPNTPFPIGRQLTSPPPASHQSFSSASGQPLQQIDHHSAWRKTGWTIRDQGARGTCVAHALAACNEHAAFTRGTGRTPTSYDGSEQFLYWGAKQCDGSQTDGTRHAFALRALQTHGLCDEAAWPYVAKPGTSVHQGPPPPSAITQAASNIHVGGAVNAPSNSQTLYQQLLKTPVAIGVPVFRDLSNPKQDNWNVPTILEYGRVIDPPLKSIVIGGHAVCVVGFEPDANEPSGNGWFIIRNSWGVNPWGRQLPKSGYWGPEPGYGQISWSYVDLYLWEMCWL
jgi:hypothetical protein